MNGYLSRYVATPATPKPFRDLREMGGRPHLGSRPHIWETRYYTQTIDRAGQIVTGCHTAADDSCWLVTIRSRNENGAVQLRPDVWSRSSPVRPEPTYLFSRVRRHDWPAERSLHETEMDRWKNAATWREESADRARRSPALVVIVRSWRWTVCVRAIMSTTHVPTAWISSSEAYQ